MQRGPKPRNEIGQTYNRLTVIAFSHSDGRHRWYDCQCACGNTARVKIGNLRNDHTTSCGCALLDRPPAHLTHGLRHSPEYNCWAAMKGRCLNPKNPKYARYGGRGITICPQWIDSFETFYADMGPRPSIQYTLGRKDNDGDYTPDNCRWETAKQQANNRQKAPPRPSHPHSLANLHGKTSDEMREIWATTLAHKREKPKICDYCGKEYFRPGTKQNRPDHAHQYCSRACYGAHYRSGAVHKREAAPYEMHPHSLANLEKRPEHKKPLKICAYCKQEFYQRGTPRQEHTCCSRQCAINLRFKK